MGQWPHLLIIGEMVLLKEIYFIQSEKNCLLSGVGMAHGDGEGDVGDLEDTLIVGRRNGQESRSKQNYFNLQT